MLSVVAVKGNSGLSGLLLCCTRLGRGGVMGPLDPPDYQQSVETCVVLCYLCCQPTPPPSGLYLAGQHDTTVTLPRTSDKFLTLV